jgi:putative phage-type endonuclease
MSNLEQRSPEWLEERKKRIGSSDIASIIGMDPWGRTAHDVWLEKKGRKEPQSPNVYMLRGIEMEPRARKKYIELTGNAVVARTILAKDKPWMASLDGQTLDESIITEIKCPSSSKTYDDAKIGKVAENYKIQCQWHLLNSPKSKKVDFFVYYEVDADDIVTIQTAMVEIFPDKPLQKMLEEAADKFMDLLKNNIEPDLPQETHQEIDTPGFIEKSNEWKAAKLHLTWAQEEEKKAKTAMIDETDGLSVIGNGVRITWVEPEDSIDWQALRIGLGITDEVLKPYMKKRAPYPIASELKKLKKTG